MCGLRLEALSSPKPPWKAKPNPSHVDGFEVPRAQASIFPSLMA